MAKISGGRGEGGMRLTSGEDANSLQVKVQNF